MRSREQVIWDFVHAWLKKATQDLEVSLLLMKEEWEDYSTCAFHAQQTAEKFIKAYLVKHQIEFRKTHSLGELIELVEQSDDSLAAHLRFSVWLMDFAVEFRYPGELFVAKETAERAIADARKVKDVIASALEDYLARGRSGGKEDG